MNTEKLQLQLQHVSSKIKAAQDAILQAQGTNKTLLEQAYEQLHQAEGELKNAQQTYGTTAINHPHFQQAYEALHDTRQQVQEAQQNIDDIL
ncbi:hypothetical protein [Virgibacillus sp. MG-45]|uniref:hypothetical protein n=1 Tax=Virgibacillus sp. MG-45 TaxID=3102791 RepID=UPI002ED8ADC1